MGLPTFRRSRLTTLSTAAGIIQSRVGTINVGLNSFDVVAIAVSTRSSLLQASFSVYWSTSFPDLAG